MPQPNEPRCDTCDNFMDNSPNRPGCGTCMLDGLIVDSKETCGFHSDKNETDIGKVPKEKGTN